MSKPPFSVLGQVNQNAAPPDGFIRLGLEAKIEGVLHQVIGRIRLADNDDEDYWHWDEWLLISEKGNYVWIQEDEGKYELQRTFTPSAPIPPDVLQSGAMLDVDGKNFLVRERSSAAVSFIEGELTYKAQVGDRMHFIDASRGMESVGIEWTANEIEFFRREKLSLTKCLEIFDQKEQLAAERENLEKRIAARARGRFFLFAGLFALIISGVIHWGPGKKNLFKTTTNYDVAQLKSGIEVAKLKMKSSAAYYSVHLKGTIPKEFKTVKLFLKNQTTGKEYSVTTYHSSGQRDASVDTTYDFRVPRSDTYSVMLTGDPQASAVTTSRSGRMFVAVKKGFFVAKYFLILGIVFLILGVAMVSSGSGAGGMARRAASSVGQVAFVGIFIAISIALEFC
jgi:hypothetical protein